MVQLFNSIVSISRHEKNNSKMSPKMTAPNCGASEIMLSISLKSSQLWLAFCLKFVCERWLLASRNYFFLLPWKMTVSEERTLQTVHAYSRPNSSPKCSILIFGGVLIARGWGEGNVGESNSNAHRAENGSLQSLLPTWPQAYSPAKERAKFTRTLPKCKKNHQPPHSKVL